MKLNTRYFYWIILLSLALFNCENGNKGIKETRPNIILLYADDLGWMDIGVQGSDYYETPNIDQMAREGMRFTNAYANAPNCAPSRASLMTGMYTPRHSIYTVNSSARGKSIHRKLIPVDNTTVLDTAFMTMADVFKSAGFSTCIAGKWHLSEDPKDYGFQTNFGGNHRGHPPSYFSPYKNPNLKDGPEGEYLPERITRDVLGWMDTQEDPFFLYYPFYLVHTPNQPKPEIEKMYINKAQGKINGKSDYGAMVTAMDNTVGSIMDKLKSLGKEKNTLIIFTSDNGAYGFNSMSTPLRGGKGMLYEGGIRVPFIVKWKGEIENNSINNSPIIGTDLLPTFNRLISSKNYNSKWDGIDINDAFFGGAIKDRPLFWHFPAYLQGGRRDRAMADSHDALHFRTTPASAMRKGPWKLIRYFENDEYELFNLDEDLSESNNLIHKNPEQFQLMKNELARWMDEVNAPIPHLLNPEYKASGNEII